jgi:hypothetical protein
MCGDRRIVGEGNRGDLVQITLGRVIGVPDGEGFWIGDRRFSDVGVSDR